MNNDLEDTVILNEYSLHCISSIALGDRKDQQDSIAIMQKDTNTTLAIIADGMGGLAGGKLASQAAVDAFCGHFMNDEVSNIPAFLYNQVIACDHMIASLQDEHGQPLHAGSTLVSAYIHNDELHFVSVGDSRLYLLRDAQLIQVTKDHNYKMILKEARKNMSEEQFAQESKKGESLISYLGMDGLKYIDVSKEAIHLQPHDYLLMCSDGLYKRLLPQQISAIMKDVVYTGLEHTILALKEEAKLAKGRKQDNTSIILAGYY